VTHLELIGNTVYVDWASHGDNNPYHGWVVAFNKSTLQPISALNLSPNGSRAGIWQSGAGVAIDSVGNLFFSTGNSTSVGGGTQWNPKLGDYPESVLRVSPTGGLQVVGYYTGPDYNTLDINDTDLGSGGTMLLPDSAGSAQHPHLLVETGKQGHIFLIDRDQMASPGGPNTFNGGVIQEVDTSIAGVWGSPAYYNGKIYYHGSGDVLVSIPIANAQLNVGGIQKSNFQYAFPGAQPSVSANNNTNGIVWELETDNYNNTSAHEVLRAFDANNLQTLLYASDQSGGRDQLTNSVKFVVPTIADGHVLVGSAGQFSVFGLFPTDTSVPAAPTNLAATTSGASSITLTWDPVDITSGAEARQIDIERSTDGTTFTALATVAVSTTTYQDLTVQGPNTYYYRVFATDSFGDSPPSSVAKAVVPAPASDLRLYYRFDETGNNELVDFANGFANHSNITTNGGINFFPTGATPVL
jgi:hypothetical protein